MKRIFTKRAALLPVFLAVFVAGGMIASVAVAQTTNMSFSGMGLTYNAATQTVTSAGTLTAGSEPYQATAVCNGSAPQTLTVTAPIEPTSGTWIVANSAGTTVANGGLGSTQLYNLAGGSSMIFGYVCQGTTHQVAITAITSYNIAGGPLNVSTWAPGVYTVTFTVTGSCQAVAGTCNPAPVPVTWSGTFTIPAPPPPANGSISVTSADSQATTVTVPATWSFLSYPLPQDNPCSGHGGSCANQTHSTYSALDLGAYQLCSQLTPGSCQPTAASLWSFNSVKVVPIASRSNDVLTALASFGKNIMPPAAMAMSTCGQFGPNPPTNCVAGNGASLSLTSGSPQVSYVILWDPIAVMSVSPTSWAPAVTAGGAAVTQPATVTNTGTPGSQLSWNATSNSAWLTLSPASGLVTNAASGNAAQSLTITANPTGLTVGSYTGTISFTGVSSLNRTASPPQSATITVTLTVTSAPVPAPTVSLSANPTTITAGGTTSLTWASTNATTCNLSWGGSTATAGTATVQPAVTTTYTVTCTGSGGTSQPAKATVTVQSPPPSQPAATLTANPTTITIGGSTTLTWSSVGATGCTASGGWSGAEPVSGTMVETPATGGTITYTLVCTGPGGTSLPAVATVMVQAPPPPPGPGAGYDCVSNACSAVASGAQYGTLSSCNTACSSGGGGGGGGGAGYSCVSNACSAVASGAQYGTLASCNISCGNSGGGSGFSCVNNACSAVASGAQYGTLASCNTSCGVVGGAGYSCVSNACSAVASGAQYGTLASCNTSCGVPGGPVISVSPTCAPSPIDTTQQSNCTATVNGGNGQGVTWTIVSGPGTISSSTGVYTPPGSVATSTGVTVKATSKQDPTKTQTTVITVNPPGPAAIIVVCTPSTVPANGTSDCNATTTTSGGTPLPGSSVTWKIVPGDGPGTIGPSNGIYTAPSTVATSTPVKITVTSVQNPTISTTVTITVTPPPACTPGVTCPACSPGLTANPASIVYPESSNLSYSCTNVTQCQLSGGQFGVASSVGANGSLPVTPTSTTPYTLACTNVNYSGPGSTIISTATVTVGGSNLCEQNPNGAGCPGAQ